MLPRQLPLRLRWHAGRLGAAALAVLCLAAQVSSLAHLALVRHVTCLEHGELVDQDERRAQPDARGSRAAPANGPSYEAATGSSAGHQHEHCLTLSERRDQVALLGGQSLGALTEGGVLTARAKRVEVPPAAVLLFAPKQSPPV